jgi:hypothetical protein
MKLITKYGEDTEAMFRDIKVFCKILIILVELPSMVRRRDQEKARNSQRSRLR